MTDPTHLHVIFGAGPLGASGMARELSEMLVQFENDFEVDSTAFESAFGWRATPLEDGFAATMERVRSANRS